MKILVTGVGGYVGKKVAEYFCHKGHHVYGVSRKYAKLDGLIDCYIGDLSNFNFVQSILGDFDVIINCAANTNHFEQFKKSYGDNVSSIKNLLNASSIRFDIFVHISTEAIFLNGPIHNIDNSSVLPKRNLSTYALTKKLAEEVIMNLKSHPSRRFVILRPRLIWGGQDSPVYKKLVFAIQNKGFFWVENGKYLTSSTHVSKLINGIEFVIKNGASDDKYFITDGEPIPFRDLIYKILGNKYAKYTFPSIPRFLIYFVACIADFIYLISFRKIRLPISRSLYFLTLSQVVIKDYLPDVIEHKRKK
jgi:nucleoside-diphosphate-sugar epimerase